MQDDIINTYTPQLYARLGTAVSLDLGDTATLVAETRSHLGSLTEDFDTFSVGTREAVTAINDRLLKVDTNAASAYTKATALEGQLATTKDAILADVKAVGTQIANAQLPSKTDLTNALDAAVKSILAGQAPSTPFTLPVKAVPLVRYLAQVKALALDQTPGEPYAGKETAFKGWIKEDVALEGLRPEATRLAEAMLPGSPQDLKARYLKAFEKFSDKDPAYRSQRYADAYRLVAEIAAFLANP